MWLMEDKGGLMPWALRCPALEDPSQNSPPQRQRPEGFSDSQVSEEDTLPAPEQGSPGGHTQGADEAGLALQRYEGSHLWLMSP